MKIVVFGSKSPKIPKMDLMKNLSYDIKPLCLTVRPVSIRTSLLSNHSVSVLKDRLGD